ncbi:Hsp20/alpha crystallin family protein [Bacillus sp. AK128]
MNKDWPQDWKKKLPSFLGEDFFAMFDEFEKMNAGTGTGTEKEPMPNTSKNSSIKVNVYEYGHELMCVFRIPGLKVKEVDIDVYDDIISVTGEVQTESYHFRPIIEELYQGPVHRKVKLPYPVRTDKIEANYKNGYLVIYLHRLLRSPEVKPKIVIDELEK